jgi:hypothetical protein
MKPLTEDGVGPQRLCRARRPIRLKMSIFLVLLHADVGWHHDMHGVNEASPSLPLVTLASAKCSLDLHGWRRGPGTTRYHPDRAHQGDVYFAPMEQRTRFCPRQV